MKVLINPRSAARLAAASAVAASLAPATIAASTALPAAHIRLAGLATDALCDGHHWSLFGCRRDPGHHRIEQPEADRL